MKSSPVTLNTTSRKKRIATHMGWIEMAAPTCVGSVQSTIHPDCIRERTEPNEPNRTEQLSMSQ